MMAHPQGPKENNLCAQYSTGSNEMGNKTVTNLTEVLIKQAELIDRKNELLKMGTERLQEIKRIAIGLENTSTSESAETAIQFCRCAGARLRMLSYLWADMDDESEKKALFEKPETEEHTIDEPESEL